MDNRKETSTPRTAILLPASCTLKESSAVKELLREGLEVPGDVELDARGIERVDTSVLQLMAAFVRDMKESGRGWSWSGVSEEFGRSTRILGLTVMLGLNGGA